MEQTKAEILRLHSEREQYEDTMKKAFMRGVCALNLEAMTMFQGKDNRTDPGQYKSRFNLGVCSFCSYCLLLFFKKDSPFFLPFFFFQYEDFIKYIFLLKRWIEYVKKKCSDAEEHTAK